MQTDQISHILSRDPMLCPYDVVAKDCLPEIIDTYPGAIVCNTHDADQPGEHWIAMYVDTKGYGDYFDPYGLEPQHRVHELYERTLLRVGTQRSYATESYVYRLRTILCRFLVAS